MKYKKYTNKNTKLFIYIVIAILITGFNIILGFLTFDGSINATSIFTFILSIMLEITGMLYFVIQDIINIKHIEQYHNVTDETTDIPFVDRKELLENILLNTYKKIKNHDFYVNYNIKYERRNGKTSLSKRVCKELIRIRDNNLDFDNIDSKFRKQIGNVFFLDYKICCDSFEKYVKSEFRLIKGKKTSLSCITIFIWKTIGIVLCKIQMCFT